MNRINNNLLTTIIEKIDRDELLYQFRKSFDLLIDNFKRDHPHNKTPFPLEQELLSLYLEFKILSYIGYKNSPLSGIDRQQIIGDWVTYVSTFPNRVSKISSLTINNMEDSLMTQLLSFEEGLLTLPFSDKINALIKEEFIVAPHRRVAFKNNYARIRNTVTTYKFRDCLSPLGNEEKNIRKKRQ